MKIDINKIETVVIRDENGKELCRIKPSQCSVTTINKKQYITFQK